MNTNRTCFKIAQLTLLFFAAISCNTANDKNTDTATDAHVSTRCEGVPMRPDNLFDAVNAVKLATANVSSKDVPPLALVPPYMSSFWMTPQLGVSHAVEELNCSISMNGPNAESSDPAADQKQMVDNLVLAQTGAIGISCKDATVIEPAIANAIGSGIPVITFDADGLPTSQRHLYMGTVNRAAGETAGSTMKDLLGATGGSIAVFCNSDGDANMIERIAGIEAALAGTTVVVAKTYSHNGDMALLASNIRAAMAEFPDLGGMISLNGHIGPILGDELVAAQKQGVIKAVAFDLLFDTRVHLQNGVIDAAIVQQSYFFGYLGGHILYAMASIGVPQTLQVLSPWLQGDVLDTGTQVITQTNVQDYMDFMECLGVDES